MSIHLPSYKAIIFDFGAVLIDLHRDRAVEKLKHLGLTDADSLLNNCHHKGVFQELELGNITTSQFYSVISSMTSVELTPAQIDVAWISFLGTIPQSKLELLKSLKTSHRVLLLSNTNSLHFDYCRQHIFSTQGYTLSDLFHNIYLSYELHIAKPDPNIYLHLLSQENLRPEDCLFVDDSPENIAAASALGMHTYLATAHEDFTPLFDI